MNLNTTKQFQWHGFCYVHTSRPLRDAEQENSGVSVPLSESNKPKLKRKKLKGKRAVIKWLKYFRWQKKKEYERMTQEEKILYKLKRARMKEERLVNALNKIEPQNPQKETTHDPEILTPEEHFYFLKMGQKCKNYVPVGRRGIYQGVILNMHLHWKKHQTLKVIVKTFTPDEVKEIAAELARLSGGIVLDIEDGNEIIMYRGKNYVQPPTEIMSPRVTLNRKKALDKSKYRDKLHAVRRFLPRLEQELEDLRLQTKQQGQNEINIKSKDKFTNLSYSNLEGDTQIKSIDLEQEELKKVEDSSIESVTLTETEDLSDIFETDLEGQMEEQRDNKNLYLDIIEKFPSETGGGEGEDLDFEEHFRRIANVSSSDDFRNKDLNVSELDEIDRMFLRASQLLKKRK